MKSTLITVTVDNNKCTHSTDIHWLVVGDDVASEEMKHLDKPQSYAEFTDYILPKLIKVGYLVMRLDEWEVVKFNLSRWS